MKHKRIKISEAESEGSMTPMIDVVFQLLIYFLVTFTTPDVLAHLDVSRPVSEPVQEKPAVSAKTIRIDINKEGFNLNGRAVSRTELASVLNRLAGFDSTQTVLISCAAHSVHAGLVDVLDICAGCGLSRLSVTSTE